MKHRVKGRTLGRSPSHRRAMLRNLIASMIEHERVVTTEARAKEAKPYAEKLLTLGRQGTLHARRLAISRLHNIDAVHKLFDDIAKRNPERQGGNTRILKLDKRRLGDNASQVIIEWVDKAPVSAGAETPADSSEG